MFTFCVYTCWSIFGVSSLILHCQAVYPRAMALGFIKNMFDKLKVTAEGIEELPKNIFPESLEGFGYHFNEKGELVNKDGGGFQFVVREGDRDYNQQHYDALGEIMTDYLYDKMEKDLKLQRVNIPVDAKKEEAQSVVFMSADALTCKKLMVLIHGSGAVRAGQWSRKLIINENIDTGSQLPYIQQAMKEGYGVLVMNTNLNEDTVNGKQVKIRGSEDAEEHGVYIWKHFVAASKAQDIVIVAHSFGGIVTFNMAEKYLEDFKERVFCVVYTDSVHSAKKGKWSQPLKDFMKQRAVNFASAYVPINTMLDSSDPDSVPSVSAGTKEHERTSHACINSAFTFIKENFESWSNDRSMAPRNFLPLPENLDDYSPARRWEQLRKEDAEREGRKQEQQSSEAKGEKDSQKHKSNGEAEVKAADSQGHESRGEGEGNIADSKGQEIDDFRHQGTPDSVKTEL